MRNSMTLPQAVVYAVIVLLVACTGYVISGLPVHHDIAWPLHVAGRALAGERAYVDIIEVHPPLILWYAMAAHRVAGVFGASPIAGYHAMTFALGILSLGMTGILLRRVLPDEPMRRMAVLLAAAVVLFPLAGYHFGLEEHLMLVLALPYLVALTGRMRGASLQRGEAVLIGALAGIGVAMKPLYGLAWLAVELLHARSRGWRSAVRPEAAAAAAILLAYPAAVLLATPAYLIVAGWAAQVYYDFHPTPFLRVVFSASTGVAAVALLAQLVAPRSAAFAELRRTLAVFLVAAMAVVFVQGKGWTYHWYPGLAIAALLLYLCGLDLVERLAVPRRTRALAAAGAAAALVLAGSLELRAGARRYATLEGPPYHLPELMELVQRHAPGGPIMVFSTTMQIGFPLVTYTGATWASRFATLWPLPGLYADAQPGRPFAYHEPAATPPLEQYLIEAVADDMATHAPALLIIDRAPPSARLGGFDYIEYFGRDLRIRTLYSQYALLTEVGSLLVFRRLQPPGLGVGD